LTLSDDRINGYAAGIFEIAAAEGSADRVADELDLIGRSFDESSELTETLADRQIPTERKSAIIGDLLGGRASPFTVNVVEFIVAAGRARDLSTIAGRLVERAAERHGETTAEVLSPVALDDATVTRLEEALTGAAGRPVKARVIVDTTILGGLVTRIGDTIIDGSLRGRLDSLRETLEAQ